MNATSRQGEVRKSSSTVAMRGLLGPVGTAANLVSDAHLAALALEHGAEVVSFDTDFARFPGLRWHPPIT